MERHLPSLCPDFDWRGVDRRHIKAIGPHLLGDYAWGKVERMGFDTWGDFKKVVQQMFGLTSSEMRRSFRLLARESGETDEEFILRVEEAREAGRYSRRHCVDDFLPKTSRRF